MAIIDPKAKQPAKATPKKPTVKKKAPPKKGAVQVKAEPPKKNGRPTIYTPELAATICKRIADGKSLRRVLREDDKMPCMATVMTWLADKEKSSFLEQYEKAREEWADKVFDDIFEIADDGKNDYIETNDPENPGYRVNGEIVARSRLRVDTRKWALARMFPKKYGEKLDVTSDGEKVSSPVVFNYFAPASGDQLETPPEAG